VRRALAAVLVGLALAACGSPPTAKNEPDVVAEALRAFDRADWVAAARLLREAVARQPNDLRLHYSLAVTVTHLELRDEAIREFQWVLANAPAGSPEAVAARNWLLAAGVLTNPSVASESSGSGDGDDATAVSDPEHPEGAVHGQVTWAEGDASVKIARMQLFLKGIKGQPNEDFLRVLRASEEGRFHFRRVPAGSYRLMDRIAGQPRWRVKVTIPAGQDVAMDLTPQNSLGVRDDFPDGK
jgi:hypothetical protein